MFGEARLFLIEVDRHQGEGNWRAFLQVAQNLQHGVAVFTAGEANHDAVAFFNHIKISDRLADVTAQALLQFVDIVFFFLCNLLIIKHYKRSLKRKGM